MRPAVLSAVCATVLLAGTAAAAPGPRTLTVADPKGDVIAAGASYDITGVTFTTSGLREGRTYTPKRLEVTLTLAAPPSEQAGSTYSVDATLEGCGYFNFSYTPGATLGEGSIFTECGSEPDETGSTSTLFQVEPEVKGSAITWTIALKSLRELRKGSTFTGFTSHTTINEPVFGILGPTALAPETAFDRLVSDRKYTVG